MIIWITVHLGSPYIYVKKQLSFLYYKLSKRQKINTEIKMKKWKQFNFYTAIRFCAWKFFPQSSNCFQSF